MAGIDLLTVEGELINRLEVFDEADLDTALARFDELARPVPRLENTASQVWERLNEYFSSGDWAAMSKATTQNMIDDDRRHTVNAGIRRGRDVQIANGQAVAETGADKMMSTVIAIRGGRLALCRSSIFGRDQQPGAFRIDFLSVIEIDVDEQLMAHVAFDPEDIDSAITELDIRYAAGEAAAHAHTWSVIAEAYAGFNRREVPATSPNWVSIDHRCVTAFAPGDLFAFTRATWETTPDIRIYVEAVHRLTDFGAVVTTTTRGTSLEGFDAESREIGIMTTVGDLISRVELFDESDLDVALARFDELSRPVTQLENSASQAYERAQAYIAARNWIAVAETLTEDLRVNDRRPVVGAGVRHGRDEAIADMRATADLGITKVTSAVIATRGERLMLVRARHTRPDQGSGAFHTEVLGLYETNADGRIAAVDVFGFDELDAAFEELDALYLAGEAAAHAQTWSVLAQANEALKRRELPATTPDYVIVDHRPVATIEAGNVAAGVDAGWDLTPDASIYIEAVHRLTDLGAVVTWAANGTSQEGFDAEWRVISLSAVEGDLISRVELFDESELDVALARFEQLGRQTPRLENAASRAYEPLWTYFAARDWDAIADTVARDIVDEDRRRVVNAGIRHGRDALIANMRAIAEVGAESVTSSVVATRGERLALNRVRFSMRGGEVSAEVLNIAEIDTDDRVAASIQFDLDDIDAAFEELDARYLAGEAAPYADTWSVITRGYAALNRREIPATSQDWVNIDHRRSTTFEPGALPEYIRALSDVASDVTVYVETVHRVSDFGALVSSLTRGRSHDGFDAEWPEINLLTVYGDRISRCEIFDEADVDAALARFDELSRPVPQLENAASQMHVRFQACFAARDWDAITELFADDTSTDDRRPLVGVGVRRGRDSVIADWRATADVGVQNIASTVIATRGERLALNRYCFSGHDERPQAFRTEVLGVIELDNDQRIAACVMLDLDDIDTAFAELDARYLAGEAAADAHTWSVMAQAFAATNRREMPEFMPGFVNIDHRRARGFAPGDLTAYMRATWDLAPDVIAYAEAVHQLSNLGAIFTQAVSGTSQDGFEAEWREIVVATVDGNLINRIELFEEADIDAALARFDELSRPVPQLENEASRADGRFKNYFAGRDWDAMAEILADDFFIDDRRRVVNIGIRGGRDVEIVNMRAAAEIGAKAFTFVVIATRGRRLALSRIRASGRDQHPEAFHTDALGIVEINADNRIAARVAFDLDDIDAAFEELDARYLAGEAAAHAHAWSVIAQTYAAFNRHEQRDDVTGTFSTTGEVHPSRPTFLPHPCVPRGTSRRTSKSTWTRCIV